MFFWSSSTDHDLLLCLPSPWSKMLGTTHGPSCLCKHIDIKVDIHCSRRVLKCWIKAIPLQSMHWLLECSQTTLKTQNYSTQIGPLVTTRLTSDPFYIWYFLPCFYAHKFYGSLFIAWWTHANGWSGAWVHWVGNITFLMQLNIITKDKFTPFYGIYLLM